MHPTLLLSHLNIIAISAIDHALQFLRVGTPRERMRNPRLPTRRRTSFTDHQDVLVLQLFGARPSIKRLWRYDLLPRMWTTPSDDLAWKIVSTETTRGCWNNEFRPSSQRRCIFRSLPQRQSTRRVDDDDHRRCRRRYRRVTGGHRSENSRCRRRRHSPYRRGARE